MSDETVTQKLDTEGADLLTLAGVNDANLIELARLTGAKVSLRGDSITLSGPAGAVEKATPVAQRMVDTARQLMPLTPDDILRMSDEVASSDGDGNGNGTSAPGGQRIVLPGTRKIIQPKTPG